MWGECSYHFLVFTLPQVAPLTCIICLLYDFGSIYLKADGLFILQTFVCLVLCNTQGLQCFGEGTLRQPAKRAGLVSLSWHLQLDLVKMLESG